MAYTAQQLVGMGYGGYQGWGDAGANADFNATGGAGKGRPSTSSGSSSSGGGFSSLNPQDTIRASIEALIEANKPAVESLQAQIPETQAKYAQTRTQLQASQPSLEQRYQNLIDQIKGNQEADVTTQTKATNATLAARGLSTQDPGAQQNLAGAIAPINKGYTGLTAQTGLAREDAIRTLQDTIANLTPQETADTRAITNAIASLSSGAGQTGVSTGLNLYSANLSAKTAADQAKAEADQRVITNAIAQAQLANQTKETNYNVGKPYSSGSADDITSLINQIKGVESGSTNVGAKLTSPPMSSPAGNVVEYPKGSGIYWTSTGNGWS